MPATVITLGEDLGFIFYVQRSAFCVPHQKYSQKPKESEAGKWSSHVIRLS